MKEEARRNLSSASYEDRGRRVNVRVSSNFKRHPSRLPY